MTTTYSLRDGADPTRGPLGTIELEDGVDPTYICHLAQIHRLEFESPAAAKERAARLAQHRKDEEALQRASEETRARELAERQLPEGDLVLETLKLKQLQALCEQAGLVSYGTKGDCIGRLREYESAKAREAQVAALEAESQSRKLGEDEVDLDSLTDVELQQIAEAYGVSGEGDRESVIARIQAAAEGKGEGGSVKGEGEEDLAPEGTEGAETEGGEEGAAAEKEGETKEKEGAKKKAKKAKEAS